MCVGGLTFINKWLLPLKCMKQMAFSQLNCGTWPTVQEQTLIMNSVNVSPLSEEDRKKRHKQLYWIVWEYISLKDKTTQRAELWVVVSDWSYKINMTEAYICNNNSTFWEPHWS